MFIHLPLLGQESGILELGLNTERHEENTTAALMKHITGLVLASVNILGSAKELEHALEETTIRLMAGALVMPSALS